MDSEIKDKSQTSSAYLLLPPCRVCGAKASGFHYGVITCEACKIFFRRSLTLNASYKCKKNKQCLIQASAKAPCSLCRWKKCLSLKMSREGITRGRYTLERRASTTKEVIQVRAVVDQLEKEREEAKMKVEEREKQFESLVQSILRADQQNQLVTPEFLETVPARQHMLMEYKKAKQLVYGPMKPVSHSVFEDVYQNCGLDIDDRRKRIEMCTRKFETHAILFFSFAKALPGFQDFDFNDKIALLKETHFEWHLFSMLGVLNSDLELYTCPSCGVTFDVEDLEMYRDNTYHQFFRCAKILQSLNLTEEELAVAKAVAVVNPYGHVEFQSQEKEKVWQVQERYVEALQYLLEKNRGPGGASAKVMGKIISCLTEMKDAYYNFNKDQEQWMYLFPDIAIPAIVRELFEPVTNQEVLAKILES